MFFFSSRRRHTRCALVTEFRRVLFRSLENEDFVAIVNAGLAETLDPENRIRLELDAPRIDPETNLLLHDHFAERRVEQMLVNRKIRDANFRNHVLDAYENTCAVTGLRIVNGGGTAEAQAAHIWSVAGGGPEIGRAHV